MIESIRVLRHNDDNTVDEAAFLLWQNGQLISTTFGDRYEAFIRENDIVITRKKKYISPESRVIVTFILTNGTVTDVFVNKEDYEAIAICTDGSIVEHKYDYKIEEFIKERWTRDN